MAKKKTESIKPIVSQGPFRKQEIVAAPSAPVYYVNNVNIDLSTWDVRLRVGQIQGVSGGNALQVNEVAHLFMSHKHFKAVVQAMIDSAKKIDSMGFNEPVVVPDGETH